jgi:tetratricopeptide (TPR) repeat protein
MRAQYRIVNIRKPYACITLGVYLAFMLSHLSFAGDNSDTDIALIGALWCWHGMDTELDKRSDSFADTPLTTDDISLARELFRRAFSTLDDADSDRLHQLLVMPTAEMSFFDYMQRLFLLEKATKTLPDSEQEQWRHLSMSIDRVKPPPRPSPDTQLWKAHDDRARTLLLENRIQDATTAAETGLGIARSSFTPDSIHLADALVLRARLHYLAHEYRIAEGLYREALQIQDATFVGNMSRVAATLNGLALTCTKLHKHDEADQLYRRGIKLIHGIYGDSPSVDALYARIEQKGSVLAYLRE